MKKLKRSHSQTAEEEGRVFLRGQKIVPAKAALLAATQLVLEAQNVGVSANVLYGAQTTLAAQALKGMSTYEDGNSNIISVESTGN